MNLTDAQVIMEYAYLKSQPSGDYDEFSMSPFEIIEICGDKTIEEMREYVTVCLE